LRSGKHQYLFSLMMSNESQTHWVKQERMRGIGFSVVWGVFAMVMAFGLAKGFTRRIRLLNSLIVQSHRESLLIRPIEIEGADEITELARQFQALLERVRAHQQQELVVARARIELEVARQVAHDLRSPLTALEVLVASEKPNDRPDAKLFHQSLRRIREVADALLRHRRPVDAVVPFVNESRDQECLLFYPHLVIEALIAEKRVEYSQLKQDCSIAYESTFEGRLILMRASKAEFTRVLSNLINNAQEAHSEVDSVQIWLSLEPNGPDQFSLRIKDEGIGMSAEVLSRLGESGFSHGKSGGSGIGFHHAKKMTEGLKGSIVVHSSPGAGTEVQIILPRVDGALPIQGDFLDSPWEKIMIVDDDPLIHEAWNIKFGSRFQIQSFESLRLFKQYFSKNFDKFDQTLILMDLEFIREPDHHGMSALIELGLERQACLVTGRHDDPTLLEHAIRAGIRVFPKDLLPKTLDRTG
jgi:signal transduction histidine kinase